MDSQNQNPQQSSPSPVPEPAHSPGQVFATGGQPANNAAPTGDVNTSQPAVPLQTPPISSIYPEATRGVGSYDPQAPAPVKSEPKSKTVTFRDGYSLGGTIFWYQLFASIIFGILLYGVINSVLKTSNITVIALASLFGYLTQFIIAGYIPYSVIKSSYIEEPFWLTVFGYATQSIIIAGFFELMFSLLLRSAINNATASTLTHIGGVGLGVVAIGAYIAFLIASYFLTKLAWGSAFWAFGKITSKVIVKAIGIAVIAVIACGIVLHYVNVINHKPATNHYAGNVSANTADYKLTVNKFITAMEIKEKPIADSLESQAAMSNFKKYYGTTSFYDSCQQSGALCMGIFTPSYLSKTTVTYKDYTADNGAKGKKAVYELKQSLKKGAGGQDCNSNGTTDLSIAVIPSGNTWLVDSVGIGFNASVNGCSMSGSTQ